MSTIDSNQSLNNILDKLGIQPQEQKNGLMAAHRARRFPEADDDTVAEPGSFRAHGKC